jgi:hypothetical protein
VLGSIQLLHSRAHAEDGQCRCTDGTEGKWHRRKVSAGAVLFGYCAFQQQYSGWIIMIFGHSADDRTHARQRAMLLQARAE